VFEQLRDVGRHVFLGTLTTALVQGTLAGIGFWVCGVPQPAFFGVLAAVASLLPALGTLLVWAPLSVYLILIGSTGSGVALLIYSAVVVVGFSDYVLRPYLVGDNEVVPTLLTFVALFGGVEVFGLRGLVVGPIVVTLAVALLRTYHAEMSSLIPQAVIPAQSPALSTIARVTQITQVTRASIVATGSEFAGHGAQEIRPGNDPA
jgi:predicted PurR-regulated permease PerM